MFLYIRKPIDWCVALHCTSVIELRLSITNPWERYSARYALVDPLRCIYAGGFLLRDAKLDYLYIVFLAYVSRENVVGVEKGQRLRALSLDNKRNARKIVDGALPRTSAYRARGTQQQQIAKVESSSRDVIWCTSAMSLFLQCQVNDDLQMARLLYIYWRLLL